MNNEINIVSECYKTGYEGVESPENFPSASALHEYRRMVLDKTEQQVGFIARHLGSGKLRVLEFCSGNGRLLVALALKGMLDFGMGVEISRSRSAFAQQWVTDLGLTNVACVTEDVLTFDEPAHRVFDLAVCVTDAFSYLWPIRQSAPLEVLLKFHAALARDGCLLLETEQMSEKRRLMLLLNNDKLRLWQPLPAKDTFTFALHDLEYFAGTRVLMHRKVFIDRNGRIDHGRSESLVWHTPSQLLAMLRAAGFEWVRLYEDFRGASYQEGVSEYLVTLAGCGECRDLGEPSPPPRSAETGWSGWMGFSAPLDEQFSNSIPG